MFGFGNVVVSCFAKNSAWTGSECRLVEHIVVASVTLLVPPASGLISNCILVTELKASGSSSPSADDL